jgi:subtilisin family serine protease
LEQFSSAGGDPILFDTQGKRLATPQIRNKPDLVAPDGVDNTFLGFLQPPVSTSIAECQNNSAFPSFFGTSAAAPHAGAVAALLLQARPTATPAQIYTALRTTTLDMGSAGFDFDTGYGFIQADAALDELAGAVAGAGSAATTAAAASSGGGGGSLGLPELVLIGLVRVLRMRPRARALGTHAGP